MDELNRRKALKLAAASGAAVSGVFLAGAVNAQAQEEDQAEAFRGEDWDFVPGEKEGPPPEADNSQDLSTQAAARLSLAFFWAPFTFLLKGVNAVVIAEQRNFINAVTVRRSVKEDANFYYVIVSRSLRYAIAKKAGLLNRHQVWIKIQAQPWEPLEKAKSKPLTGNTP